MPRNAAPANPRKRKTPQDLDPSLPTSLASRRRRAPTCSIASLKNLEDEVTLEDDFVGYFGEASESHYTWGRTVTEPITATKKRRNRAGVKLYGGGDIRGLLGLGEEEVERDQRPNGGERSYFLRWGVEVRERIYGMLVGRSRYWKGIVIKHDLSQVESINLRTLPLLRVCRQLKAEVTHFLYTSNVFRAVLRAPRITYHLHESFIIAPSSLPLLRNLILESHRENYSEEWFANACVAVEKLAEAQTPLQSLTLVVVPQRLPGGEVTFGEWLEAKGKLLQALVGVKCGVFNVVVKKQKPVTSPSITLTAPTWTKDGEAVEEEEEDVELQEMAFIRWDTKRYIVSLDMTYHSELTPSAEELANEVTRKLHSEKRRLLGRKLASLKRRFEIIFHDSNRAVAMGLCRRMKERENLIDVVSLRSSH